MENENFSVIVKENEFNHPNIQKIDDITNNVIRDCHNKYFQTFEKKCAYYNEPKNIADN